MQNMRKDVGSDEGSKAHNYTRPAVQYNSICMQMGEGSIVCVLIPHESLNNSSFKGSAEKENHHIPGQVYRMLSQ